MTIRARYGWRMATCVLAPNFAWAFNLGDLHGQPIVGHPLQARVDLYASSTERRVPLSIAVLPDLFSRQNRDTERVLSSLAARVEQDDAGYSFIHLMSGVPLTETPLTFRLRVEGGTGAVIRHYALQATAAAPTRVSRRAGRRVHSAHLLSPSANSVAGQYGPVQTGESLWSIAQRLGHRGSQAWMNRIHAANPQAFVNGDINRLKSGVFLALAKLAPREAPPAIAASAATPTPLAPQPTVPPVTAALAVAPEPVRRTSETGTPSAAIDPILAARLTALDAKFAAIRAEYAPQVEPSVTPSARDDSHLSATPTPNRGQGTARPAGASAVAREQAPAVTAAMIETDEHPFNPLGLGALGLGALAVLGLIVTKITGRRRSRTLASAHHSEEAGRKADVARKAELRLRSENDLLAARRQTKLESTQDLTRFEATLQSLPLDDTYTDIDINIAHGRYQTAEKLLQEVISAAPRNVTAKTRLAEIYYITERAEEFGTIVEELQQTHRAELSNEEWQRIVRMGKIIAPTLALFSGPRVAERRAS